MGRRIIAPARGAPALATSGRRAEASDQPATSPTDGYLSRVVKYVPAEIIAVFVAVVNYEQNGQFGHLSPSLYLDLFYALVVATPIYILLVTRQKNQPPAVTQAIVSTIVFLAFAYATPGGPFGLQPLHQVYNAIAATIVLPVVLFLAGFIVPKPLPLPQ